MEGKMKGVMEGEKGCLENPCHHGSCAICLYKIVLQETELLKGCEHAYCVTCILRWASYNKHPKCPQCKNPFESLHVHRSLDGSLHDYMLEESVCLLLRASWFKSLIVVHKDEPYDDSDDDESMTSLRDMMLLWQPPIQRRIWISRRVISVVALLLRATEIFLTATISLVSRLKHEQTIPYSPFPRTAIGAYLMSSSKVTASGTMNISFFFPGGCCLTSSSPVMPPF